MRGLTLVLALAACLGAVSPCLLAQRPQVGSISGQVRLSGGGAPPGRIFVEVQLRGAAIKSTFTDNEGRFSFFELRYNAYNVVAKADGYLPARELVVVRPDISPITLVRLILHPQEKPMPEAPAEAGFGGNPHLVDSADYSKQFPSQAIKEFEAGVRADQDGKTEKAVRHYRNAIRLAPDFYPAHNNLGSKYVSAGDFTAAETEFAQVIRLNASDAQAYFNLGNVFFLTSRYEEAERTLQEGLKREPGSGFGHFLLGSVYVRGEEFGSAEQHLRTALDLDPQLSAVRLELVNLYLLQQRPAEAVKELKSFTELFPDDPLTPKAKRILERLESSTPPSR